MKNYKLLILFFFIASITLSCNKDSETDPNVTAPKITILTSNKTELAAGGVESAEIECIATGTDIKYTWEVDLGDIIPMNETASKVQFTGSDCCIGEKQIRCTVSNAGGKDSKIIILTIVDKP